MLLLFLLSFFFSTSLQNILLHHCLSFFLPFFKLLRFVPSFYLFPPSFSLLFLSVNLPFLFLILLILNFVYFLHPSFFSLLLNSGLLFLILYFLDPFLPPSFSYFLFSLFLLSLPLLSFVFPLSATGIPSTYLFFIFSLPLTFFSCFPLSVLFVSLSFLPLSLLPQLIKHRRPFIIFPLSLSFFLSPIILLPLELPSLTPSLSSSLSHNPPLHSSLN